MPDARGGVTGVSAGRGSTGVDRAGVDGTGVGGTGVGGPGAGGTPEETSGEVDGSPSVVGASVSVVVGVVGVGVGGRVCTAVRGAQV